MGFIPPAPVPAPVFVNDEARWAAVQRRDRAADGAFVFAVRTTGIFCRPSCASRHPRRENASFHADPAAAERAGFRPCLRCKPTEMSLAERQTALVVAACRKIETAEEMPSLDELAEAAGLSRFHFHRMFKSVAGVTPKAYADAHRADRMRDELEQTGTVTEAIYGAGFNSNGRFYAAAPQRLGMTPTAFRDGGTGAEIRFAIGQSHLGAILVAATDKGIVAIQFGDDPQALLEDLQDRFPKARLVGGDAEFEQLVARVVGFVEAPSAANGEAMLDLPLDIRGTAFQQKVWQALRSIPAGSTASYAEIARRIDRPKAVRAVAQACAANDLAVAIPCHRVVRSDGDLSGYRWGVARKRALLDREAS